MTSQGHTLSVIWKVLTLAQPRTFFSKGRHVAWEHSFRFDLLVLSTLNCLLLYKFFCTYYILPVSMRLQLLPALNQCRQDNFSEQKTKTATRSLFLKATLKELDSTFHLDLIESNCQPLMQYDICTFKSRKLTKGGSSQHDFFQWCTYYNAF